MCTGEGSRLRGDFEEGFEVPDWEKIPFPPAHVLSHLTDAHCHPTDLTHPQSTYDVVPLGGLGAMSTVPEDQDRVKQLSSHRGWSKLSSISSSSSKTPGPRVVACFGYHPWFVHRYTLAPSPPSKQEHYTTLFFPLHNSSSPPSKNLQLLHTLLPYLPDPIPFAPLLDRLRADIRESLDDGRLTMVGEVGLDGGARMRWPVEARDLYPEKVHRGEIEDWKQGDGDGDEEEWKRLTPFKVSMAYQRQIVEMQLEVAIELGVNVSFHSVAAPGPTYDVLLAMRKEHGARFENRVNVDIHSGGGWSGEFWSQAQKNLSNIYASPSLLITGRSSSAPGLIRAISKDRMLVESDSHDVRLCPKLVWGAVEWIGRCKGWRVEWLNAEEEEPWEMSEAADEEGEEEIVRILGRNWAQFMQLIE